MNKDLRERRVAAGVCALCGGPLDTDGLWCRKCRDKENTKAKSDRQFYLSHGICPYCRTEKLFGSERSCPECRVKRIEFVEKNRRKNLKRSNERSNEYHKKTYLERKQKGLCVRCGKRQVKNGNAYCKQCLIKKREYEKKAREKRGILIPRSERVANGLCYICGAPIEAGRLCKCCAERAISNLPDDRGGGSYWKGQNKLIFGR